MNVAIHNAFDEARRALESFVRKRRKEVKRLDQPSRAYVVSLFQDTEVEGYGFIRTDEGRDLYFHSNSVLEGKFHHLQPGVEVRFSEEMGEKGPQASSVELIRRRAA